MDDLIDFGFDEYGQTSQGMSRDNDLDSHMSATSNKCLTGGMLNNLSRCEVQDLEEIIRTSIDDGICCSSCKELVKHVRYICITCEDVPSLCEMCLEMNHSAWHITIRKPLMKKKDDDVDSSVGCQSFLPCRVESGNEEDMRGSYTTCSGPENEYLYQDLHELTSCSETSSEAGSEWDRVSIVSLPDCFNLDRIPTTLSSSFVKIPSDCKAEFPNLSVGPEVGELQSRSEETWTQLSATGSDSFEFEMLSTEDHIDRPESGSGDSECENAMSDAEDKEVTPSNVTRDDSLQECGATGTGVDQSSVKRTKVECFERSFHDVLDPFSSSEPEANIVDFIAQAAQHVSEVAIRTVDTFKKVLKSFHYDHLGGPVQVHSYDWIPPSAKWTRPFSKRSTPCSFDTNMSALIEMGFANRALNAVLINKFGCNFEQIVEHIVNIGYKHEDYDACFMVD